MNIPLTCCTLRITWLMSDFLISGHLVIGLAELVLRDYLIIFRLWTIKLGA
jgi:hypothetical protein